MEKKIEDYLHLYLGCECEHDCWDDADDDLPGEKKGRKISELDIAILGDWEWFNPKPILRPLSDMTEEEKKGLLVNCLNEPYMNASGTFSISKSGYLGISQESGYVNFSANTNALLFLLSKHFDLFRLIEAGLAIDKTKPHNLQTQ